MIRLWRCSLKCLTATAFWCGSHGLLIPAEAYGQSTVPKGAWETSTSAVEERLRADATYLAADDLEGRGVRTKGLDAAAEYIAKEFQKAGLNTSLYNGTPFHEFRLYSANPTGSVQSVSVTVGDQAPQSLILGEDYSSLMVSTSKRLQGRMVFVGYGITDRKRDYDDYANIDVRGKVVVMLRHEPRGPMADRVFDGPELTQQSYLLEKIANAYSHGAIAIVLCTDRVALQAEGDDPAEAHRDELLNVELTTGIGTETLPVIHCRREFVNRWVQAALSRDLDSIEAAIERRVKPQSAELTGITLNATVAMTRPGRTLRNVVGSLPGAGRLAEEAVVVGAHYDHLGRGGWGSLAIGATDEVHNGADDNASGTAVMMEVARMLASRSATQRRQVIFIAFSGEELGLYGSKRYVEDPLVPLNRTVAMLNLDMVGRLRNETCTVYGTGTAAEWPSWLLTVAETQGLKIISKPSGFGPSDHTTFHEYGIPVLHFFTGFHNDYHRPGDDAEKLNIVGMRQITHLVTDLVSTVQTVSQRPRPTTSEQTVQFAREERDRLEGILQGGVIARRIRLGIALELASGGLRIRQVERDGIAFEVGLREGDVLKAWDQKNLAAVADLQQALAEIKRGETPTLTFERGGIMREIQLQF